jgi:hypothetical protein
MAFSRLFVLLILVTKVELSLRVTKPEIDISAVDGELLII